MASHSAGRRSAIARYSIGGLNNDHPVQIGGIGGVGFSRTT
jgi:hypothetical protein